MSMGFQFSEMIINRIWAMPNKHTFLIKPIGDLISRFVPAKGAGWIDPFAGENSPAELTNDLNPEKPTKFHLDGLQFLMNQPSDTFLGTFYDPVYSFRQAAECYASYGKDLHVEHKSKPTMMDYWANCKKHIYRITKTGGYAICCGWNTNGINNGMKMIEILIVPHGGSKNDTLVTVEQKIKYELTIK